jgi:hypothetical protein
MICSFHKFWLVWQTRFSVRTGCPCKRMGSAHPRAMCERKQTFIGSTSLLSVHSISEAFPDESDAKNEEFFHCEYWRFMIRSTMNCRSADETKDLTKQGAPGRYEPGAPPSCSKLVPMDPAPPASFLLRIMARILPVDHVHTISYRPE